MVAAGLLVLGKKKCMVPKYADDGREKKKEEENDEKNHKNSEKVVKAIIIHIFVIYCLVIITYPASLVTWSPKHQKRKADSLGLRLLGLPPCPSQCLALLPVKRHVVVNFEWQVSYFQPNLTVHKKQDNKHQTTIQKPNHARCHGRKHTRQSRHLPLQPTLWVLRSELKTWLLRCHNISSCWLGKNADVISSILCDTM